MEKWFGTWDAIHLLHDASLDSSVNEAFLQCQCIMTWDKGGGLHFTYYTTHVAPDYKTIFFTEREKCALCIPFDGFVNPKKQPSIQLNETCLMCVYIVVDTML